VVLASISTCYSYCWDLYMDWGLLRADKKKKEPIFLRKTLRFPSWFYYQAAFVNLCLRLSWTLPLLQVYLPEVMRAQPHILTTIIAVAECYRRAQWAIIRIENEQINNFENYRNQSFIEDLMDDDDLDKN
jgi:EXS family